MAQICVPLALIFLIGVAASAIWLAQRQSANPARQEHAPDLPLTIVLGGSSGGPGRAWSYLSPPPREERPEFVIIGAEGDEGDRAWRRDHPLPEARPDPAPVPSPSRPGTAWNRAADSPELIEAVRAGAGIYQLRKRFGVGYERAKRLIAEHGKGV